MDTISCSPDPSYISPRTLLKDLKAKEIKEIAYMLEFRLKPSVKGHRITKADYLNFLPSYLLEKPQQVVEMAYYFELKAWLEIIEGKITRSEAERAGYWYCRPHPLTSAPLMSESE